MVERGVEVDHATLNRWVVKNAPLIAATAQARKRPTAVSWRMDERYIKVKGKWIYYYRAVDKIGANLAGLQCVNVILKFTNSRHTIKILQVKYLNNIKEHDHRFIERITRPMLGLKALHSADATLAGIETAHMIRKGQLDAIGLTAFLQFGALAV